MCRLCKSQAKLSVSSLRLFNPQNWPTELRQTKPPTFLLVSESALALVVKQVSVDGGKYNNININNTQQKPDSIDCEMRLYSHKGAAVHNETDTLLQTRTFLMIVPALEMGMNSCQAESGLSNPLNNWVLSVVASIARPDSKSDKGGNADSSHKFSRNLVGDREDELGEV